ncbi:MAG: DUF177 domain-containing protein [Lachnospiraceae bacterium]|nr:DUF177 domain-containing protein [Lachnospiraceae bacterium]
MIDEFTQSGKTRFEKTEYPYDEFLSPDGFSYRILSKSDIELKFSNVKSGQILLEGRFDLSLGIPCDRCLKEVEVPISLKFQKELLDEEHRDKVDDEDEFYGLQGTDLDIKAMIDQEILINLPSKVLCREDCKGICPVCGSDRNVKQCDCDTFVPDPRMAGIMDIFMANKEV